jgi:hypothetical protein
MTVIISVFIVSAEKEIATRTLAEEQWQRKCYQQQDRINQLEEELSGREVSDLAHVDDR